METEWRPSSRALDARSLRNVLAENSVVVLHFWAGWNRIDREFDKHLMAVREEFGSRIFFGSVDTDEPEHREFIGRCGVGNLPAFACFIRGERVETVIGCRETEELRRRLEGWLALACGLYVSATVIKPGARLARFFKRFVR